VTETVIVEELKHEPLPVESLSPAVAGLVHGATPAKLMAVRGMAPLRPAELVTAIYQLSFDKDPVVAAAAETAPAGMPDRLLLGSLGEQLPARVLHFFAERTPATRRPVLEKILYNHATDDGTFVHLARNLDEEELEIIFQNEVRLLRCPAIVEALYFNKQARMSSVSRALELCARNSVRLDGIPGFAETAAAILAEPYAAAKSNADEVFAAVMTTPDAEVAELIEDAADVSTGVLHAADAKKRGSVILHVQGLRIHERIRLASVGNAAARRLLIRDSNRLVAMAAVRSPLITEEEIVQAAANRAVCEDVIRFIANSRDFSKHYAVKQALANNPKCPLALSLRLLSYLRPGDLKALGHSKNIPGALSSAARELLIVRKKTGA
jgi:hypothetical protein